MNLHFETNILLTLMSVECALSKGKKEKVSVDSVGLYKCQSDAATFIIIVCFSTNNGLCHRN